MSLPIVYSFRRCPYAMRARLGMHAARIRYEVREVVLREKPAHMLEISPKGTVPVLWLPDGQVIDESYDVMKWALAQHDPDQWLERQELADALVTANDIEFKPLLDRYKYAVRHPEDPEEVHQQRAFAWIRNTLGPILEKTPFLAGKEPGLADAALGPFIRQCANHRRGDFNDAMPRPVVEWLDTFLGSDAFAAVMTKRPQWKEGDTPTIVG